MADRLRARGKSWEEFVELVALINLDEEDRKQAEKAKRMRPILPPPHAVPKGERKPKEQQTSPSPTTHARHDLQPAGYYRNRRGRPA